MLRFYASFHRAAAAASDKYPRRTVGERDRPTSWQAVGDDIKQYNQVIKST